VIGAELVLFDHCLHDLPVDSRRIGYGGPPWVLRTAARFSPRPGLVILLDMQPEAPSSDRLGIPAREMARQRSAYLDLARNFPSQAVINASQEPAALIHDAMAAVLAHLERRTRKRLDLQVQSLVQK
jgi:thymidylate kinase